MIGDLDAKIKEVVAHMRVMPVLVKCTEPGKVYSHTCDINGQIPWPMDKRLALMAYCGDETAMDLVPLHGTLYCEFAPCPECDDPDLSQWLDSPGLDRWPHEALIRAAVAAGWMAAKVEAHRAGGRHAAIGTKGCPCNHCRVRQALEAAEAWLAYPCKKHLDEWISILRGGPYNHDTGPKWQANPPCKMCHPSDHINSILAAANLAGEAPVREKIQEDLIKWAYGL